MQSYYVIVILSLIIFILLAYILKFNFYFIKRKFYQALPKKKKCIDKPYSKFKFFDKAPIIENIFIKSYTKYLKEYFDSHGKELKPVKSTKVPASVSCPYCNAPHQYLYDNNGGKGQFLCKVCSHTFKKNVDYNKHDLLCPYCQYKLTLYKDREDFYVYKCGNYNCSCYLNNLNSLNKQERKEFKKCPSNFSLHYNYRVPKFDFKNLLEPDTMKPINRIGSIRCSHFILGLILTYRYNYSLSCRKIAALLYDVHQIKISHATINTYCHIVAPIVKYFLDNFKYDTSGKYCGDETYVKVKGKWTYVIFFFDSVKKIILSYGVFEKRDALAAITAINSLLTKVKLFVKDILIVTDANPIYNVAHLLFKQHGIHFTLKQVVGLSNKDDVSKEFRPFKQIIERLNRTFKELYNPSCGYNSLDGATADTILFAACYNFLRPNVALGYKVPVELDKISSAENMPLKWCQLIATAMTMIENS